MQNRMNLLMTGLEFVLKQVTLADGSKPINSVKKATELESGALRKSPEYSVLSQDARDWDGENAELGTQEIHLDVWGKSIRNVAGANQITSNTLLESVSQAIREQAGHLSSQPFGAGTDLTRIEPVIKDSPDDRLFAFKVRLTYNVLWG